MVRGLSVPARDRLLADRLVQALLPFIEERLDHKFAAFEQHIEERLQAGEKRMGKRFGVFSRQVRGEATQTIRQCLEESG